MLFTASNRRQRAPRWPCRIDLAVRMKVVIERESVYVDLPDYQTLVGSGRGSVWQIYLCFLESKRLHGL